MKVFKRCAVTSTSNGTRRCTVWRKMDIYWNMFILLLKRRLTPIHLQVLNKMLNWRVILHSLSWGKYLFTSFVNCVGAEHHCITNESEKTNEIRTSHFLKQKRMIRTSSLFWSTMKPLQPARTGLSGLLSSSYGYFSPPQMCSKKQRHI